MDSLPAAVLKILMQRVLQETSAAWLLIDATGILKDMGGSLSNFGLSKIEKGCVIQDQAVFLEGILSMDNSITDIASIQIDNAEYADVYLLEDDLGRWVVLLGRTATSRWKGVARQKANELKLLQHQQHSTKLSKLDFSNLLGILSLEKNKDESFTLLEPIPGYSCNIYPETSTNLNNLHPEQDFPFLAHFIETCQSIWNSKNESRLKSGPWIEVDNAGKEYALEATALLWHNRKILLIERIDDSYQDNLAVLQHARENSLIKQQLEKELQRQKIMEQNLIEARAIAEQANQAKSDFLSSMSHELRTPLNAILGFSQLLINNPDDPLTNEQTESVNYILTSGKHLLGLIGQILELSKIESGILELFIEDIVPSNIIKVTLPILQVLADKQQILISYEDKLDVLIKADSIRFKQVIINLLSNAIKYNRKGGTVTVTETITKQGRFRLLIKDNGIGIPKNEQNQLFTAFSRLGQEHSGIEGTGVGLVVTKTIIEAMDGQIGFESIEGKGSTFWVELPLSE